MDIPKPLLLVDAAINVLYLPFDPLSPLSRSYHCKKPPPTPGVNTPSTQSGGGGNESSGGSSEGGSVAGGGSVASGGSGSVRGGSATSKQEVMFKKCQQLLFWGPSRVLQQQLHKCNPSPAYSCLLSTLHINDKGHTWRWG